jgi:phosphoribosylformylglycinamidine synthase
VEQRLHDLLHDCARQNLLASAHDCSDGGLAVALAESAIAGDVGCRVSLEAAPGAAGLAPHVRLFSESAARVVLTAGRGSEPALEALCAVHGVPVARVGETGGRSIAFEGLFELPVQDALVVFEGAIPRLMAAARRTE